MAVAALVALGAIAASGQTTTETSSTTTAPAPSSTAPSSTAPSSSEVAPSSSETTAPASPSTAPEASSTTLGAEERAERARAVANLNLAKAADVEIAAQLKAITEEANRTVEKVEAAERRLEEAEAAAARSAEQLAESGSKQREIEGALMVKAIEGYKTRSIGIAPGTLFAESSVNQSIRQNQLLDQASSSTTELLEELRALLEDRRVANAEAELAEAEARAAEQELQSQLETLQEQQATQLGLKAEAERRIDLWAAELTAYAREDAAIQAVIVRAASPAPVEAAAETATSSPTTPSTTGFQWPIQARVTSEYGYRIHPIYGSRRLHAGIDLGAPRGTPIAASNGGVVIFAGTQGGYGRTVIVDHGGGITTLYAHMSEIGASTGQTVNRGDVVGLVGATGTATGNHLHFEVRVNGGPVNPRNYLP